MTVPWGVQVLPIPARRAKREEADGVEEELEDYHH